MKRERKYRAAIDILKKHIYYWEDVDYGGDSDDLKKDVQNLKDATPAPSMGRLRLVPVRIANHDVIPCLCLWRW
jgi:hypothetical protein